MKLITAAVLIAFSSLSMAHSGKVKVDSKFDSDISLYYKSESNGDNEFTGFGSSILLKSKQSNFGVELNTTVSNAEVIDKAGYFQDFIAWEAGVKLGYFSNVFFYGEAGFDLGEFIFEDRDETIEEYVYSGYDEFGHYYEDVETHYVEFDNDDNRIDAYVGIGAGINFGSLKIEAFSRIRQVDGDHWVAPNTQYSGIQLSLTF